MNTFVRLMLRTTAKLILFHFADGCNSFMNHFVALSSFILIPLLNLRRTLLLHSDVCSFMMRALHSLLICYSYDAALFITPVWYCYLDIPLFSYVAPSGKRNYRWTYLHTWTTYSKRDARYEMRDAIRILRTFSSDKFIYIIFYKTFTIWNFPCNKCFAHKIVAKSVQFSSYFLLNWVKRKLLWFKLSSFCSITLICLHERHDK